MNRLFYCAALLLFSSAICTAPNVTNLQKMAYAIDDFDIPKVKDVLSILSDDEKTGLMHKKIAIIQQVGFAQKRHRIRLIRTPEEQIASMRSVGVVAWNIKLYVIEALLLQYAL